MNCLFYTNDLSENVKRLMPWRFVLEVANKFSHARHNVFVVSGASADSISELSNNKQFIVIEKNIHTLHKFVVSKKIDVIFYPIASRDAFRSLGQLKRFSTIKIGYVTGGVYSLSGVFTFLFSGRFNTAVKYLVEFLTPQRLLVRKLREANFYSLLTFSNLTAEHLIKSGWDKNKVKVAFPGRDECERGEYFNSSTSDNKYYLFAGSPSPIRGSLKLLAAFDRFADSVEDARLIMLMRKDDNVDFKEFKSRLKKIRNREKITIIYDLLHPDDVRKYLLGAYAVILPFILIPSEIPLTFIEAIGCRTPVITFKNGGTYDYIQKAAIGSDSRSSKSLADMMISLWNDNEKRDQLSIEAGKIFLSHPTWKESAKVWMDAIL